mmetsp:Transcript_62338/g.103672  ORF Transcript_62338/g.103672 Transcript_62338/m.103672 type:complete len:557 (-) Transcript_62338:274-1944(-)
MAAAQGLTIMLGGCAAASNEAAYSLILHGNAPPGSQHTWVSDWLGAYDASNGHFRKRSDSNKVLWHVGTHWVAGRTADIQTGWGVFMSSSCSLAQCAYCFSGPGWKIATRQPSRWVDAPTISCRVEAPPSVYLIGVTPRGHYQHYLGAYDLANAEYPRLKDDSCSSEEGSALASGYLIINGQHAFVKRGSADVLMWHVPMDNADAGGNASASDQTDQMDDLDGSALWVVGARANLGQGLGWFAVRSASPLPHIVTGVWQMALSGGWVDMPYVRCIVGLQGEDYASQQQEVGLLTRLISLLPPRCLALVAPVAASIGESGDVVTLVAGSSVLWLLSWFVLWATGKCRALVRRQEDDELTDSDDEREDSDTTEYARKKQCFRLLADAIEQLGSVVSEKALLDVWNAAQLCFNVATAERVPANLERPEFSRGSLRGADRGNMGGADANLTGERTYSEQVEPLAAAPQAATVGSSAPSATPSTEKQCDSCTTSHDESSVVQRCSTHAEHSCSSEAAVDGLSALASDVASGWCVVERRQSLKARNRKFKPEDYRRHNDTIL